MRVKRSDRGAVLVLTALLIVFLFAVVAFVIDLGNLRQTRRQLTTATDAAALAVAQQWIDDGFAATYDCTAVAADYVVRNSDAATLGAEGCEAVRVDELTGYVTVNADEDVDYTFAQLLGFVSGRTASSTTVRVGPDDSVVGGLRPFALCAAAPEVLAWVAGGAVGPLTLRVPITNNVGPCGTAAGNFGTVDLPAVDGTGNVALENGFRYGAGESIPIPTTLSGDTGIDVSSSGVRDALTELRDDGTVVWLPAYTAVTRQGTIAEFQVVAAYEARLVDFVVTGNPSNRSLTFELLSAPTLTECCSITELTPGAITVSVCAVDDDEDQIVSNCSTPSASP